MDFFKTQLARLREQIKTLNATQKMLAGTLLVIILMTLYGWSNFAGRAEMETLLNQPLSSEDIGEIQKHLASSGIKYRVVGDRIEVPADRKYEAIALLGFAQALPRDTKNAFDEMIAKASPLMSNQQQAVIYNQARQNALAQILRYFPRVRNAMVIIDSSKERAFSSAEASATVYLNLRSKGSPDQRLVNAAADLVAGAVANLKRDRVKVIIDDVSYPVRGSDDANSVAAAGDDILNLVRSNEQYLRERLYKHFSFIDGVQIDVTVKPNLERKEMVTHTVDPKNVIQKPVVEETQNEETISGQKGGGEPGIVTNGQMAAGGTTAAGESNTGTQEKNRTESKVDFGATDVKSWKPPGDVEIVGVSMLVPRSHFIQTYKRRMRDDSAKDPDETILKPFIASELVGLKGGVKICLALPSDDAVHVDAYTDLMPLAAASPQAAASSLAILATDHLKEIALGALALVSLFMVTTMVRKTAVPSVAVATPPPKPPQLTGDEETVGEAIETNPILDGMELDEESVRAQQMVNQVSNLVGENPEAATAMVKRWLNRS